MRPNKDGFMKSSLYGSNKYGEANSDGEQFDDRDPSNELNDIYSR